MKKNTRAALALVLLIAVLAACLTGCGGFSFTITTMGNHATVKVEAGDGEFIDGDAFTVGKGQAVMVDCALESGQMQLDIWDVMITSDDFTRLDIVETVTVEGEEGLKIELPPGDYSIEYTTVGDTKGTLEVDVVDAD